MSNGNEARHAIEVQSGALGPILHAGVAAALAGARSRNSGLDHVRYPHLLPLVMRAEMREFLEASSMVNDWRVDGDPRKMGQLLLVQPDLNMEMRFLKERRGGYPGGIPVAGSNRRRRQYWSNDALDLEFDDAPTSELAAPVRLLLLWDFASRTRLDEFKLRIAHPLEPGTYGSAVSCDLVLDVKDGGEIFKSLEFTGSADDDDLFGVVRIDEEDISGT